MFNKQLEIFNEWANVVNRAFLRIFQAETNCEIRPSSAPTALDHILEFEDGSEVYDIAAYSLNQLNPSTINFRDDQLNSLGAQQHMRQLNDQLYEKVKSALESLKLPYFIYDKYLLFKIDQAVCCQLFQKVNQLLSEASRILKSKAKSILAANNTTHV